MTPLSIDSTLRDRWRPHGQAWEAELPPGWGQGRALFGGLPGAFAVALARRDIAADRPLRTVHLQLPRPSVPGRVEGRYELLREGKSASFVQARLWQQEKIVATAQLVFGKPREGVTVAPKASGLDADPEDFEDLPYIEGVLPEFTRHVAMRWASGGVPFSGASEAAFEGFCRFRGAAGGVEGLVALTDVWPCASLSVMRQPTVASTVTWTLHLLTQPDEAFGARWWSYRSRTEVGRDGFHTARAELYDDSGALAVLSQQLVAVFG